jgi:quercetin dioxygenase-like cupin family protein
MTTQGFVVTHAKDAQFERGLRSFFEYRDLGLKQATQGRVTASVIRAAGGHEFSSQPHLHHTEFQLVYVLKGWIEFEYEGQGPVRLEAGSCVHQPPGIGIANWVTARIWNCSKWCCPPTSRPRRSTASTLK